MAWHKKATGPSIHVATPHVAVPKPSLHPKVAKAHKPVVHHAHKPAAPKVHKPKAVAKVANPIQQTSTNTLYGAQIHKHTSVGKH